MFCSWVSRSSIKWGRDMSASCFSQMQQNIQNTPASGSPHPACQCKVESSHCRSVIGHYHQFTRMKLPVKPFKSAHLTEWNLMGWLFRVEVKRLFRRLYTNIIFLCSWELYWPIRFVKLDRCKFYEGGKIKSKIWCQWVTSGQWQICLVRSVLTEMLIHQWISASGKRIAYDANMLLNHAFSYWG